MPRIAKPPRLQVNAYGIYEIRWTEKGKSKRHSTGAKTLKDAELYLSTWTSDTQRKVAKGSKISNILDDYWEAWAHDTISAATTNSHIKLMKEALGFLEITELTPLDVQTYVRKRRKGLTGNRPVGDGTIRRELTILIAAVNHAIAARVIRRDDAPVIPLPPMPPPRERYLERDEIALLTATAVTMREGERLSRLERFLALAIHTGARKEAILKLTWDRVDFAKGLIEYRDPGLKITKKRRATVPISDALLPVLQRAYNERKGQLVLDTAGSIRSVFERAVAKAGLEEVSPHTLRHTWATHASMNGVGLTEIARVLGNTLAVVEKTYAKFAPGYLRNAVNAAYGGKTFEDNEQRVS